MRNIYTGIDDLTSIYWKLDLDVRYLMNWVHRHTYGDITKGNWQAFIFLKSTKAYNPLGDKFIYNFEI